MPGPPPNPNAVRRNRRVGLHQLPSEGRRGRTPPWPLPANPALAAKIDFAEDQVAQLEERELDHGKLTASEASQLTRARERLAVSIAMREAIETIERKLWREAWRTPQAVQWERLRWTHEVAMYCRWMAAAECGQLEAGKEARQYADRLGLNSKSMRQLMWTVVEDELGPRRQGTAATGTEGRRRRLSAVDDTEANT